jgi:hypothetical protein
MAALKAQSLETESIVALKFQQWSKSDPMGPVNDQFSADAQKRWKLRIERARRRRDSLGLRGVAFDLDGTLLKSDHSLITRDRSTKRS